MLGYNRWQLFKGLAAAVGTVSIVSLLLIYFIPSPTVESYNGDKGSSFEYCGHKYREIFARFNVDLELRPTSGAVENIKILQDPRSGVQLSLMVSGVSDGKHAPGLLS